MRRLLVPVLVALSLSLVACRSQEGPAQRYRRFAELARAGKAEEAWAMLSSRSRARLEAQAKELAAHAPAGVLPTSGPELLLGDLSATAPRVKSVAMVRESRDAAVVAVQEEGGRKGEVQLVREDGAWRVVLPE